MYSVRKWEGKRGLSWGRKNYKDKKVHICEIEGKLCDCLKGRYAYRKNIIVIIINSI